MWAGVALAITIVALSVTYGQRKKLIVFFSLIVALSFIFIPLLSIYSAKTSAIIDSLYARGASLTEPEKATSDSSWLRREKEIGYAKIQIQKHPLLGIGPGNDYRPDVWSNGLTGFVHNSFYFILLDLGIVGSIPFIWFSILFLVRGFRFWPTVQDKYHRAISLGILVSFIAALVHSVAIPIFMEWNWTPVLGVLFGINEVIYKLNKEEKN
jgi:O-antigen ligase